MCHILILVDQIVPGLKGDVNAGENTQNALSANSVTRVRAGSGISVTIHQVNAHGTGPYFATWTWGAIAHCYRAWNSNLKDVLELGDGNTAASQGRPSPEHIRIGFTAGPCCTKNPSTLHAVNRRRLSSFHREYRNQYNELTNYTRGRLRLRRCEQKSLVSISTNHEGDFSVKATFL